MKVPDIFSCHESDFRDTKTSPIVIKIFKKHLVEECFDEKPLLTLIQLSKIVLHLISRDEEFKIHLNRILVSISKCQETESAEFLTSVLKSARNHLDKKTVKIIYTNQVTHLIEKPVMDDFVRYVEKLPAIDGFQFESCGTIFQDMLQISNVFRLVSVILKEVFVKLNYAKFVIDFTKLFLNEVRKKCDEKKYLRLYPNKLQPCVILMKIEPKLHSKKSKQLLFDIISDVSLNNNDDLLILVMHFPAWLEEVAEIMSAPFLKPQFCIESMDCL